MLVCVALSLATSATAAPHKILVLPVDGSADAATRTRLTAQIVRLARSLDGQVGTAEATFADTALAVGCDSRAPQCSSEVLATLGVDELVWGTANKDGEKTRLVVRRAGKGIPVREVAMVIASGEPAEKIDAAIAPVFAPPGEPAPAIAPPPTDEPQVAPPVAPEGPAPIAAPARATDHRDRNLGIALAAGGGASLVLGIALLASYSSLQESIDGHATRNRNDFEELRALEDKAATYAIAGDIAVVVGLAAGGLGTYYLVRNHRRHRVAVTPMATARGAGLVLTILGGP